MLRGHGAHAKEACHAYVWHVTHMCGVSHTSTSDLPAASCFPPVTHGWSWHTHMNESCHTHERVMSHTWTSHATDGKKPCQTCERVMSHMCTNESYPTYERVVSRIRMSHVTPIIASCRAVWMWMSQFEYEHARTKTPRVCIWRSCCHTCEGVMSHVRRSHGTHENASWHTCKGGMARVSERQFRNPYTLLYTLKRALYTLKRALYTLRRAPYTPKRAFIFSQEPYTLS